MALQDDPAARLLTEENASTWLLKNGLILSSPDGTKYRITVANGGAISAVAVP